MGVALGCQCAPLGRIAARRICFAPASVIMRWKLRRSGAGLTQGLAMVFTVGLPGGTRDFEFEAYVRLLEHNGVDVARTQRVMDPAGNRWLYAWRTKADAEKFARDLRQATENDRWEVRELPAAELTEGPLGPIEIVVSRRSDGCAYTLSPTSRRLVLKRFPHANLAPNVFISTTNQADFERTQGPIWNHIALILTGLSESEIADLGGYRVMDPAARRVLRDITPAA